MGIVKYIVPFHDGWYPRLSPDGKYLLFGNIIGRVMDVATKQIVTTIPGSRNTSAGWFDTSHACTHNDQGIYRVDGPAFTAVTKVGPPLSFMAAGGNLWAGGNTVDIWVGDQTGNARKIAAGHAATVDELGFVTYAIDVQTDPKLVVWRSGQIQRTIATTHATNRFIGGAGGYVGYGYNGPSWLNTPQNVEQEVGVTPTRRESPPLSFRHLGQVWLATTDDHGVYLRPIGVRDKAIIIGIEAGAVDCSVVSLGDFFLVASQDQNGGLTLTSVTADTAMIPVPGPTPQPPGVPAKATIASFETPITFGKTSRWVAKVTQGKPEQFRWQWQDGGIWHTGATNPATDLDHSFGRPNPPGDNVFPSPGRYPGRLQVLVNGVVVDQTSTLRVMDVQPVTPEPPNPEPPEPNPVPPTGFPDVIKPSGQIFRTVAGAAWRYKGVSAFKLCRRFTDGENIEPFLSAYAGFNVLRVWDYTDWTGTGWASCSPDQWRAFLRYVGERGWTVELTLLTTDEAARVPVAKALVEGLAVSPKPTNLLIEIGNEPTTHKNIDTKALKSVCDASGFTYASGNYEDSTKAFGPYLCAHTQRDSEWPRRAHDLLEYYNGHGPHKPEDPAHKCPCIGDEPAKWQDVSQLYRRSDGSYDMQKAANDWRAYFGTAAILGAGATFHSETGKFAQVPTTPEQALIAAALEGLNAFPPDAPIGAYSRPSDKSLRTYVVGNYSVRIRPTTSTHPVGGFVRTGASDILWRKS